MKRKKSEPETCLSFPIAGISMETSESRGSGPQHVPEARPSLVQVHSVYRHFRHVPPV